MNVTIVSAYNTKVAMTVEFLDQMAATTRRVPQADAVSMVLVNGGCDVKIEHPFITRRIDLPVNEGFCPTLNHGLRAALAGGSDWIFFVGNDSFPVDDQWLPRLLALHVFTDAMMTCPANDNPGMEFRRDCYVAEHADHWEASWFPSIAWLMRTADVARVGLLDEGYLRTGMFADNDYCDRVRELGGKIVVSKDILLRHRCSQEGAVLGTQAADMHTNALHYAARCRARSAAATERAENLLTEAWSGRACPRDTDGDGDCGRPWCPDCGPRVVAQSGGKR